MPTQSDRSSCIFRIRTSANGSGGNWKHVLTNIQRLVRSKSRCLRALLEAESFEIFLHTRYVGQKRFSLQGAETLMVALETILHKCPDGGVEEICMGMAHRGRLNVLANFLRKSLKVIFTEFSENYIPDLVAGDGDVKYHLGYQAVRRLASGAEIEIRLSSNPSHLEAVDPVVEGKARARQRIRGDTEHRKKVLPLLVHGDAAFIATGNRGRDAEFVAVTRLLHWRHYSRRRE